jgi:thioredoxin-related protein
MIWSLEGRRRLGQGLMDPRPNMAGSERGYWVAPGSRQARPGLTQPAALLVLLAMLLLPFMAQAQTLPPPIGPETPRVEPMKGDDGIYHQKWYVQSFLDLREDYAEAEAKGKRFAVVFEQRGCVYCTKMHTEVLAQKYINDYVRENYQVLQLDLWGAREVTDFDGTKMPEKKLAERWGVMFTPTIVFYKDGQAQAAGWGKVWGQTLEVTRMSLGFGAPTFYDLFVWVRAKVYVDDRNFQRFHIARTNERDALKK